MVFIVLFKRKDFVYLLKTPRLWWIAVGAGMTNASFNWAVTIGDVVRVVLLFYLMPIWAVFLARWVLKERITIAAGFRIAIALVGAMIVLKPATGWIGAPQGLVDWLAILGGFSFALNNVMLKREADQPNASRAIAMFLGGALLSGLIASFLTLQSIIPGVPPPTPQWVVGVLALSLAFAGANFALQYGASRLPANVTAVVMLTEILFAAASTLLLTNSQLQMQTVVGGLFILAAALLAVLENRSPNFKEH